MKIKMKKHLVKLGLTSFLFLLFSIPTVIGIIFVNIRYDSTPPAIGLSLILGGIVSTLALGGVVVGLYDLIDIWEFDTPEKPI